MRLRWLKGEFVVARLARDDFQPELLAKLAEQVPAADELHSVTWEADALSVVGRRHHFAGRDHAASSWEIEPGWRAMAVCGPLSFDLIGVLSGLAAVLADSNISIVAVSTFDTDYLLVKAEHEHQAQRSLQAAGYTFD